jgi:HK97 family phage major capsid protein
MPESFEVLKKSVDQLEKTIVDFKAENDKRIASIEKKGYAPADLEEKVDRINADIDAVKGMVDKLATERNRPETGEMNEEKTQILAKRAVNKFMRYGKGSITAEEQKAYLACFGDDHKSDGEFQKMEQKALQAGVDPDGGYFIRPEVGAEITKKVFESSPIRQLASVQQISGNQFEEMADWDEPGSGWAGEVSSVSVTDTPEINKLIFTTHELRAMPKATEQVLEDASIDLEAWLAEHVAAKFARDEATAFVTGNGVNKPKGLMSYSDGSTFGTVEQVISGSAATVTADGLLSLQGALKEAYQPGAVWGMPRATLTTVRKLKDNQGLYLWSIDRGLNEGPKDMLLGKPVYMCADIAALGASALYAFYGDIKQAYRIVDRVGMKVLRDPFSSKPYVLFYTRKRVGGGVKNFEAYKIGKCST